MKFEELFEQFCDKYAIEGVVPDENGTVGFKVDDTAVILMKDRKDEGRVNIIAEIGEMPEQGQGELSSLLLKANFLLVESGGAILCQNPENNVYMLFLPLDTDGLTTDEFCVRLDAFLGKLDDFKEIVKSFHPLYQDSDEESEMNGFYLSNLG